MSTAEKTKSLHWFGFPKIMPYMKTYRKWLITMMIMGVLASLIDSVYPLFNRYALDHFVSRGTLDTMKLFILAYMVLLILQPVVMNYFSGVRPIRNVISTGSEQCVLLSSAGIILFLLQSEQCRLYSCRVMSDTGKIGELVAAWR